MMDHHEFFSAMTGCLVSSVIMIWAYVLLVKAGERKERRKK